MDTLELNTIKNKFFNTGLFNNKMETKRDILVFIVDDDPMFLKVLENWLLKEMPDLKITTFPTGEACLHSMHLRPDIVIIDYYLNSEFPYAWNGIQVLKRINWQYPATSVIIFSSKASVETAMKSIHEGAYEYVDKNEGGLPKIKEIIQGIAENIEVESSYKKTDIYKLLSIILVIILITIFLLKY
jgi:DNA-binding NtrC family response regulator